MQVANIDSVDIVFWVFFPPIGALVIYGCAYGAARTVAGGRPISPSAKRIAFYGAIIGLGIGYLEAISLVVFKLPDIALWASGVVWVALVVWLAFWRRRKEKQGENQGRSEQTD
jgi:hypothetical protein